MKCLLIVHFFMCSGVVSIHSLVQVHTFSTKYGHVFLILATMLLPSPFHGYDEASIVIVIVGEGQGDGEGERFCKATSAG